MHFRLSCLIAAAAASLTFAYAEDTSAFHTNLKVGVTGETSQFDHPDGSNHTGELKLHNGDGSKALARSNMKFNDGYMTTSAHGCAGLPENAPWGQQASGQSDGAINDAFYVHSDTLDTFTPVQVTFSFSFAYDVYSLLDGRENLVNNSSNGAFAQYKFGINALSGYWGYQGYAVASNGKPTTTSGTVDDMIRSVTITLQANNYYSQASLQATLLTSGDSSIIGGVTSLAGASASLMFGAVVQGDAQLISIATGMPWGGSQGNAGSVLPPNPAKPPVPEPASFLGLGLGAAVLIRRRRS